MMTDTLHDDTRERLMAALLPNVAFDGWTMTALRHAATDSGVSDHELLLAFPNGAMDALLYSIRRADSRMLEQLAKMPLDEMRIRDRITTAVRIRLENEPDKEAVRRGVTLLAQPQNAPVAAKLTWATVDAIWRACGDRSHDYNYYTKRGLLSGVWTSTLLYWLNDRSEGDAATWAFLDRRIGDVMRIPKLTAPFRKAAARFPSPLRVLERLRAGNPFPSRRASGPTD